MSEIKTHRRYLPESNFDLSRVGQILGDYLSQNAQAIAAVRAYWQLSCFGTFDNDQLKGLEEFVKNSSQGRMDAKWGGLCTIFLDDWQENESGDLWVIPHHDTYIEASYREITKGRNFIRGSSCLINHPLGTFELLLLDDGHCREAFDAMDEETRKRFARDFGERRRTSGIFISPVGERPLLYIAVISNSLKGSYVVETIAQSRLTSPILFHRM